MDLGRAALADRRVQDDPGVVAAAQDRGAPGKPDQKPSGVGIETELVEHP